MSQYHYTQTVYLQKGKIDVIHNIDPLVALTRAAAIVSKHSAPTLILDDEIHCEMYHIQSESKE